MKAIKGVLHGFLLMSLLISNAKGAHAADIFKSAGDLLVTISDDGSYDVMVDQTKWLTSGDTWFQYEFSRKNVSTHTLSLLNVTNLNGWDAIGAWSGKRFLYQASGGFMPDAFMETEIRVYQDNDVVCWGQTYLNDTYGTSAGSIQKTSSGFPTFHLFDQDDLGYFTPRGYFAWEGSSFGRWTPSKVNLNNGYKMGPIALYDRDGRAFILSHLTNFMGASYSYDSSQATLSIGPLGKAHMIPKGFSLWTIGYLATTGINDAFAGWGETLRKYYDAPNRIFGQTDLVNNYLGYWTDRGLCYYYATEPGKNYQETILDIWQEMQQLDIPIQYIQYDSWFYPKDANQGLMEWIPKKDAFPSGMQYILNKTNLAAASHCRWWSPKTPMAKQNGGKYEFIVEDKMSLPIDDDFFYDILSHSKTWGNVQLNQDWLGQMFEGLDVLQTNVTIGTRYMRQIGRAALATGMMVELCTAYPRHSLAGLEIPTATVNRVSDDYQAGNSQWAVGVNSAWMWPLGQTPFKDAYWTSATQTCPAEPGQQEKRPALESVVIALTAGPTGWGDLIGNTNRSLLMRCCNEEGLILKPSRPATAIDAVFLERSFGAGSGVSGEVWSTYSEISGVHFGVIFGANVNGAYKIGPSEAGFGFWPPLIYEVHSYSSSETSPFSDTEPLVISNCTELDFCLDYVTPVFKLSGGLEVIVYGEMSKWIPMSPKRVTGITADDRRLQLALVGASQEVVTITAKVAGQLKSYDCNLSSGGRAKLSIPSGSCDHY